jgi:glycine/D-amino acid oxidase-like deaminating enzyme
MSDGVFHPDFTAIPYWWEAWRPTSDGAEVTLPSRSDVAIVGGGYTGVSAAIELANHGVGATVIEANEAGFGASTRSGGAVSGGINIGKSFSGKSIEPESHRAVRLLSDAADAFSLIERIITDEKISCVWEKRGRFVGAWATVGPAAVAWRNATRSVCSPRQGRSAQPRQSL